MCQVLSSLTNLVGGGNTKSTSEKRNQRLREIRSSTQDHSQQVVELHWTYTCGSKVDTLSATPHFLFLLACESLKYLKITISMYIFPSLTKHSNPWLCPSMSFSLGPSLSRIHSNLLRSLNLWHLKLHLTLEHGFELQGPHIIYIMWGFSNTVL